MSDRISGVWRGQLTGTKDFAFQMNEQRVKYIVGYCVKIRLFDAKVFKFNGVITCVGVW